MSTGARRISFFHPTVGNLYLDLLGLDASEIGDPYMVVLVFGISG